MMKHLLNFICFAIFITGNFCFGQYSVSGYLDTEEKNKRVYLSLIDYDDQMAMASKQVISSTISDSLGYFSFTGQLLSDKHALYRVHANITEESQGMDIADVEELKNFHNFVFSNNDTIVFQKNNKYWFSSNTNTNPVDFEWQAFDSYAVQLRKELSATTDIELQNQSSAQILSELKSYAISKDTHPLTTLLLLHNIPENTLKDDFLDNSEFYLKLEDHLNEYYNYGTYAKQYKELVAELSITETQLQLNSYKRLAYVLGVICFALLIGLILLFVKLKQTKNEATPVVNFNLTNQEERIAELIFKDKTNKEIATELFISLSTVKTHIRNLYAKLEVSNRQEFMDKLKNHPRD